MAHSSAAARPQLAAILPLVLASLSYDPNYAEDMEADEQEEEEEEADEDECASVESLHPIP